MTETEANEIYSKGSVFQINPSHGRQGWIGAFVLADEIRSWGIVGFVQTVLEHDRRGELWIRLKWSEIDYIGRSDLELIDAPSETSEVAT